MGKSAWERAVVILEGQNEWPGVEGRWELEQELKERERELNMARAEAFNLEQEVQQLRSRLDKLPPHGYEREPEWVKGGTEPLDKQGDFKRMTPTGELPGYEED